MTEPGDQREGRTEAAEVQRLREDRRALAELGAALPETALARYAEQFGDPEAWPEDLLGTPSSTGRRRKHLRSASQDPARLVRAQSRSAPQPASDGGPGGSRTQLRRGPFDLAEPGRRRRLTGEQYQRSIMKFAGDGQPFPAEERWRERSSAGRQISRRRLCEAGRDAAAYGRFPVAR